MLTVLFFRFVRFGFDEASFWTVVAYKNRNGLFMINKLKVNLLLHLNLFKQVDRLYNLMVNLFILSMLMLISSYNIFLFKLVVNVASADIIVLL